MDASVSVGSGTIGAGGAPPGVRVGASANPNFPCECSCALCTSSADTLAVEDGWTRRAARSSATRAGATLLATERAYAAAASPFGAAEDGAAAATALTPLLAVGCGGGAGVEAAAEGDAATFFVRSEDIVARN